MKGNDMTDVVALGELLIDFATVKTEADGYPVMAAHPGGAPANFLAAISKQGGKTALLGKVGNDSFGKLLKNTLNEHGIDTRGLILSDDFFTTLAFVTFDESGDRQFAFARKPGADTQITFDELDLSVIDEARVFHFGTLSLTDEPARECTKKAVAYAKEKGKLITCDPNLRKPLWRDLSEAREQMEWAISQADIVKISDEEVDFLWGLEPSAAADKLIRDYGIKLAFVTCGAKGAFYVNKNAKGFVPALTGLKVIDTTGAGDIFGGSAIFKVLEKEKTPELLTEEELFEITSFATSVAGHSTEHPGGM